MKITHIVKAIGANVQPTIVGPFPDVIQANMWANKYMKDRQGRKIDFEVLPMVGSIEPWRPFEQMQAAWGEAAS